MKKMEKPIKKFSLNVEIETLPDEVKIVMKDGVCFLSLYEVLGILENYKVTIYERIRLQTIETIKSDSDE